jgi:hypothetical protein
MTAGAGHTFLDNTKHGQFQVRGQRVRRVVLQVVAKLDFGAVAGLCICNQSLDSVQQSGAGFTAGAGWKISFAPWGSYGILANVDFATVNTNIRGRRDA